MYKFVKKLDNFVISDKILSFEDLVQFDLEPYDIEYETFEKTLTSNSNAKYYSYEYERLSARIQDLQIYISKTVVNQDYLRNHEVGIRIT